MLPAVRAGESNIGAVSDQSIPHTCSGFYRISSGWSKKKDKKLQPVEQVAGRILGQNGVLRFLPAR
jgi:hypothetical protein